MTSVEAARAYDEVASLYRNDLLTEPSFEWVYERDDRGLCLQERYRQEFERTTKYVARLLTDNGHPDRAVRLYKTLLHAEPTLEDIARELYRCYAQMGDRNALVQEHRHLQEALRQMLGEPQDADDVFELEPESIEVYEECLATIDRGRVSEDAASQLKVG